ncbi:zinc knuckle CX2CX4HX4C containing protein [Tanacetum coccineum]|uniref:Zinc knuckle CX2CX4HX4C containing protein n=1 Tax=Tanacetum coccineum TaxID=301880 RepID=A0ABQ5GQ80_9ASTR
MFVLVSFFGSWGFFIIMEQDLLNKATRVKNKEGVEVRKPGFILSDMASKVKNIEGKVCVKDGKPMKAYSYVTFGEPSKGMHTTNGVDTRVDAGKADNGVKIMSPPLAESITTDIHVGSYPLKDNNSQGTTNSDIGASNAKSVHLSWMSNDDVIAGADIAIPLAAVQEIRNQFANTLYGYFIRKRLAFHIVEAYARNTWSKFGFERVIMRKGFYLFQFLTKAGMAKVLENGPWLIRLIPIFLNIWSVNTKLERDVITMAPVWVKIHNVPIGAFSEVGLSLITSKLGGLIMMDAYTSDLCLNLWGRNSYSRVLVEVSSTCKFVESLVVAIPFEDRLGHSLESLEVEFEWKPPWCETCKIFDHWDAQCPKRVVAPSQSLGLKLPKTKSNLVFRPVTKVGNVGAGNKDGKLSNSDSRAAKATPSSSTPKDPPLVSKTVMEENNSSNVLGTEKEDGSMLGGEAGNKTNSKNTMPMEEEVDKVQEESSLYSWFMEAKKASTGKLKSSVMDLENTSDKEEVYMPGEDMSKVLSLYGGGSDWDENNLDCYDGYEAQVFDLPHQMQAVCDQYDVRINNRNRK